jgi:hypothetical protein
VEERTLRASRKDLVRRLVLAVAEHPSMRTSRVARWLADVPARGWIRYPRDLGRLHAALVAAGRALPLGQPFTAPPPPLDEAERAAARVRSLFD